MSSSDTRLGTPQQVLSASAESDFSPSPAIDPGLIGHSGVLA